MVYGYVGNKAASFPLQMMGYDVMPLNTVQFSNHTGYGKWQGEIFSAANLQLIADNLHSMGFLSSCQAVLSGYIGSAEIGETILNIVRQLKTNNPNLIHLSDPVMGDFGRGIFVKPDAAEFFQAKLHADIVTPNHFEAELLSGIKITCLKSAEEAARTIRNRGIKMVVITSLQLAGNNDQINIYLSTAETQLCVSHRLFSFDTAPNGTGDLFSALFLGNYLKTKNAEMALNQTAIQIERVIESTFSKNRRELDILSFRP